MKTGRLCGLLLLLLGAGCARRTPAEMGLETDATRPAQEWLRREPVRLLRDYVRIDTTREFGEEKGAEFLRHLFECAGIQSDIVCPAPRRCNLLARLPGRSREGALLLINHIDVVGAFPGLWKEAPPFEGRIKLGFLYGRGAYDMKSLALAQALAMRDLKAHGIVPSSDILFLAEADEESEQRWGSRWLLEHRPEWFANVAAALNEGGTNEVILRTVRFWGIETVQAGYALIELESPTREPLLELARRWSRIQSPVVEPLADVVLGFDMLANHLGHPLTDPLRHLDRVRRNPAELAILPDRYGCFLEARIKWSDAYAYPPEARSNFRSYAVISTPPGLAPEVYLGPIAEDASRQRIRIVESFSTGATNASPYRTASGRLQPLPEMIRRAIEARYPGVPFGPVPTFGGATTSIYFRRLGIPTYGYSPVPANITDAARRHGNDERIYLRDYLDGLELYRAVLEEFAFAKPEASQGRQETSLSLLRK